MYISNGNIRMKIPTFSLPATITCDGSTGLCRKYCYAKKAERNLNPRVSRRSNLVDTARDNFVDLASKEIRKKKSKYIRIHESGDFYSQKYLDDWFKIIKKFPKIKFLTYTQMYNLDWSKIPSNLVVYWSVWPDSKNIPVSGLFAYVIDNGSGKLPKYKVNGKTCHKGKNNSLTCDKCLYCIKGKGNIIFELH